MATEIYATSYDLDEDDYIVSKMNLTIDDWINTIVPEQARAAELINWLYGQSWGMVGGPLHIVTDDANIEDEHFDGFLIKEIERYRAEDDFSDSDADFCKELHELFKNMTRDQRAQTIALAEHKDGPY